MSDAQPLSRDDDYHDLQTFLARYDAPAYVRRARQVEQAYEELLARCRRQREEWLKMTRLALGTLAALAGDWAAVRPLLADDGQLERLRRLHDELRPRLRFPPWRTSSQRVLRRALAELRACLVAFNSRWEGYLRHLDLSPVNDARDGYNRYYLLEKECALRSPRLAREGFRRLEPLTPAQVAAHFPSLPVPQ